MDLRQDGGRRRTDRVQRGPKPQSPLNQGHVSEGVAQSLFAKLDAAQAAVDRGQPALAIDILQAFVQQVEAQAGKSIEADHAMHMVHHAEMVIEALAGQ